MTHFLTKSSTKGPDSCRGDVWKPTGGTCGYPGRTPLGPQLLPRKGPNIHIPGTIIQSAGGCVTLRKFDGLRLTDMARETSRLTRK